MKKYRLLDSDTKVFFGRTLFRIQALNSFGDVQIYGDARVYGDAHISEDARISGNAYVCDNAYVGGNSWVFSDADILYINGIGSTYPCITVCMTRDRKLFVMRQPFFGTLSEFETEVKKTYGDSKNAREYQLFIELVKLHFNIEEN